MDESISQVMEESVEVVKTVLQEQPSEKICEQGGVIEVSKISSQDRMSQRTVKQTLDESCVPRELVQQRTAKQMEDAPQVLEEVVEMERSAPHEQELQPTAVQMAEMFREESRASMRNMSWHREWDEQAETRLNSLEVLVVRVFLERRRRLSHPDICASDVAPRRQTL